MRLLALSWDVDRPGRLDPQVHGLARALQRSGTSCDLVCLGSGPTATSEVDGVAVTWVAEAPPVLPASPKYDLARVLAYATRATAVAERNCQRQLPDVVLAVGWQTAYTATAVRASHGVPILAVLDSTALERADDELDDASRLVAQVEWWLTYEARRVVTSSDQVRRALRATFRLPADKVEVIPHGVVTPAGRARNGPLVFVSARADLATELCRGVGEGRCSTDVDDVTRAPVAVVLEDGAQDLVLAAMAAGAAVIVPDDGPLRGLVHARRSGVRVTRDVTVVRDAVVDLLEDAPRCRRLGAGAQQRVASRHDWGMIAQRYLDVASRAVEEEASLAATGGAHAPLRPLILRSPLMRLVGDDSP